MQQGKASLLIAVTPYGRAESCFVVMDNYYIPSST